MNRLALIALLTLAAVSWAPAVALADTAAPDRFVLVVGFNGSDVEGVDDLQYADDDAARFFELLAPGATQAHLLTTFDDDSAALYPHLFGRTESPTRAHVLEALEAIQTGIDASSAAGRETVLHVVFSGHGSLDDTGDRPSAYLNLAAGRWSRDDMVAHVIEPERADYTHLVIDACNAFFLVQGRGWQSDAITDDDLDRAIDDYVGFGDVLARHPRVGVLLSTVGAQEVFEWGRYRSGVFSHQLRSGLVGAADVDADGRITYDEIVAWIAAANIAVRNPDARITATGAAPAAHPDVPLLTLDQLGAGAVLELPAGDPGHYIFEDERGLRYADVTTAGDRRLQIVLTAGLRDDAAYYVEHGDDEARIEVGALPPRRTADGRDIATGVSWAALTFGPVLTASRSAVSDEFRMNLFAVPFSEAFYYGYTSGVRDGRAESVDVTVYTGDPRPRPHAALGVGSVAGLYGGGGSAELGPALSLRVGRRDGWLARAEVQHAWGVLENVGTRRAFVGLGGGWGFGAGQRTVLGLEGLIGNQWLTLDDGGTPRRDNFGVRFETRGFIDVELGALTLALYGGPVLQAANRLVAGDETYLTTGDVSLGVVTGAQLRVPLQGRDR